MLYSPEINILLAALLGLVIGSFLNVVIHRLPKMMELEWAAECASRSASTSTPEAPYNLRVPHSSCPHCGHGIRWHENLPVLSYVLLRGKCSACGARISVRYPTIELLTAALFATCVWQWGITPSAGAWALFSALLLTLAAIDWDTTLLPDDLTLPLLWAGLCASALGWIGTPFIASFWGAVTGYMSLWIVFWAFKLATGKDGMGYGDFKLFAALGAWFGWPALVPIILMASVVGAVVGIALKFTHNLREGGYVPFGPFLAIAGFTALWVNPAQMLVFMGL